MKATYKDQALRMNHQVKYGTNEVPDVTFDVYAQACILLFTPFLWWLYHALENCGFRVTPLRRIGRCNCVVDLWTISLIYLQCVVKWVFCDTT